MTDDSAEMSAERFASLAETYGGSIRRWPEAERTAAAAFAESKAGRELLSRASGLDAMLDSYAVAAPASELRAQVLRRAEYDVTRRRRLRLLWWGLGLFGVGLAGALAGAFAVTIMLPRAMPDALGFSPVAADLPDLGAHSDAGHKDR